MPKVKQERWVVRVPVHETIEDNVTPVAKRQIEQWRAQAIEQAEMRLEEYRLWEYRRLYIEAIERVTPEVLAEFNNILRDFPPFFPVIATHGSGDERSLQAPYVPGKGFANLETWVNTIKQARREAKTQEEAKKRKDIQLNVEKPYLEKKLYDWLDKRNLTDEWIFELVQRAMQAPYPRRLSQHLRVPKRSPEELGEDQRHKRYEHYAYEQRAETDFRAFDPLLVDKHSLSESYESFEARVRKNFEDHLKAYEQEYFAWVKKQRDLELKEEDQQIKHERFHFESLALYQCKELSYKRIEKEFLDAKSDPDNQKLQQIDFSEYENFEEAVRDAIRDTAALIGVTPRTSKRGPKRKNTKNT
jgi:hypothetical protein